MLGFSGFITRHGKNTEGMNELECWPVLPRGVPVSLAKV